MSPVVDAHPVLHKIANADRRVADEFTAVFEMRRPACRRDPKQGIQVSHCTFTSSERLKVLVIENSFPTDPIFRDPSTPGYQELDFDESGNLIIWRSLGKKAISTPSVNRVYDTQELSVVAPSGRIVEKKTHSQVYEHAIGSPDSLYEVGQMQLATGRGFARHLSALKSERVANKGLTEILATGTFGPAMAGEWTLEVEPDHEHLVRFATFRVQGMDEPSIRIVTQGLATTAAPLPLASMGTLQFGRMDAGYGIEFRLIDYRLLAPDSEELRKLREELSGPIPDGMEVIDYSGYEPRRYVAGRSDGE